MKVQWHSFASHLDDTLLFMLLFLNFLCIYFNMFLFKKIFECFGFNNHCILICVHVVFLFNEIDNIFKC